MSIKEAKAFVTGCTTTFTRGGVEDWLNGLNEKMLLVEFKTLDQFNTFVMDNKLVKGVYFTLNIITLEALVYAGTPVIPVGGESKVIKGGFDSTVTTKCKCMIRLGRAIMPNCTSRKLAGLIVEATNLDEPEVIGTVTDMVITITPDPASADDSVGTLTTPTIAPIMTRWMRPKLV